MLNVKEIKKLIRLCRSQGIKTVKYGDVELTLGEAPEKRKPQSENHDSKDYTTDIPTSEQMLMWSVNEVRNEDN
jgi:hypothetical protein